MRFNIIEPPATPPNDPRIGDVYRMKGGRKNGGFWLIIGQTSRMSVCLGIDHEGSIVSGTTYGTSVFEARDRVGYCAEVADLVFDIEWERQG